MRYHVGDILEGVITGVQPYGAFVKVGNEVGLVHISEITDGYVKDIHQYVKKEQKIRVKVMEIDEANQHYKLSIKALHPSLSKEKRRVYSKVKMPDNQIGFDSLANHLDSWIEEELNREGETYD